MTPPPHRAVLGSILAVAALLAAAGAASAQPVACTYPVTFIATGGHNIQAGLKA
jgi:hypothetical protein